MADGDGGVLGQQQQRGGLAHDVGAADDHGIFTGDLGAGGLDHADAACRGAGQIAGLADLHAAHVDGRETVHILLRRDGVDDGLLVDLLRQGQLDQDTVYGGVVGQLLHLGQQGLLRGIGGQIDAAALDAALGTIVDLAAHIHLAGGVFAHQNDRQAGVDALGFQCGDLLGGLGLGGGGQCLTVNNTCSHDSSLFQMYFLSLRAKRCRVLHHAVSIAILRGGGVTFLPGQFFPPGSQRRVLLPGLPGLLRPVRFSPVLPALPELRLQPLHFL